MRLKSIVRFSKIALFTSAVLGAAVVGGSALIAWFLVRPGSSRDYDCVPFFTHGKLEPLTLLTSDGLRLHAWVLLSDGASPNNWVLLLHGYRSDRAVLHNRARFYSELGFNVLLLHFRGHGGSDPARITYGYQERKDVKAAVEFIRSIRPGEKLHLGINGISMGAAAASYAVGHGEIEPDWMILESCYDKIRNALANRLASRIGHSLTPWIAWPVEQVVEQLIRLRAEDLDPAKALEKARCPILLMAGDAEVVLKMVEIEYLYGSIPEPKRFALFPGAGHEDLLAYDSARYEEAATAFLRDFAPEAMASESVDAGLSPQRPSA